MHEGSGNEHTDALPSLKWPPPGLERTQGDLLQIAARAGLAGGFLVAPMLFVAAREQDFATFGPFADAWWVMLLLPTIGLAFSLDTLARTARTLRRAAVAAKRGYTLSTIFQVLADRGRDMGFLLTGARHFSVLERRERDALAAMRVVAALLFALAGLWLILGLSIGLFFAANGVLSPSALQMTTLAPALVGYAFGGVALLVQESRVRRARRIWFRQPWSEDLAGQEIESWKAAAPDRLAGEGPSAGLATLLGYSGVVVGALSVLVVLPVLTLAPASAVAPILTAVSSPSFDNFRMRAARAEAYRTLAVAGDVSITPQEAGRLLHSLMYVGREDGPVPGEQPPSVEYDEPWFPGGNSRENPLGIAAHFWGDSLLARAGTGLTSEQRAYLEILEANPANDAFRRLARATALDAGSARWELPFSPATTMATVPVPRFGAVREAAYARVGMAVLAWSNGDSAEAEEYLTEIISVGLLLADEGPTLIDNLIGVVLVETGGSALEALFRVSGQAGRAAELSRLRQVAERVAERAPAGLASTSEGFVRSLPGLVLDPDAVHGFRWEYFINLATIAPCMNLNRMVFGAGEDYDDFLEEARALLVRYDSDAALFELARHGWAGTAAAGDDTLLGRVAGLYMSTRENSCATLVRHMDLGDAF